jgi:hypothetical protein
VNHCHLWTAAELYIPIPEWVLPYILVKQLVGTSHHLLGRGRVKVAGLRGQG